MNFLSLIKKSHLSERVLAKPTIYLHPSIFMPTTKQKNLQGLEHEQFLEFIEEKSIHYHTEVSIRVLISEVF